MKKICFIGIMTFCMITLYAKEQPSMGVKADLNLSNFRVNESIHFKSSMKTGGSAGFFWKYNWYEYKVLEVDVMLRYKTSELKNLSIGETADYRYFGIELPVYSLLQVDIGEQILYFGIGAFASFGLFSSYESAHHHIDLYLKDSISGKTMMRRCDFGMGFKAGYELKSRLQFNFSCQIGFRNIVNDWFENVNMISQTINFGVGYRF